MPSCDVYKCVLCEDTELNVRKLTCGHYMCVECFDDCVEGVRVKVPCSACKEYIKTAECELVDLPPLRPSQYDAIPRLLDAMKSERAKLVPDNVIMAAQSLMIIEGEKELCEKDCVVLDPLEYEQKHRPYYNLVEYSKKICFALYVSAKTIAILERYQEKEETDQKEQSLATKRNSDGLEKKYLQGDALYHGAEGLLHSLMKLNDPAAEIKKVLKWTFS